MSTIPFVHKVDFCINNLGSNNEQCHTLCHIYLRTKDFFIVSNKLYIYIYIFYKYMGMKLAFEKCKKGHALYNKRETEK